MLREDQPDHKRLVAYVVLDRRTHAASHPGADGSTVALASPAVELREHLKRKVPDYMLPAAFVVLDRLPLSPSGKVDGQALPVPDRAEFVASENVVPPRTPTEAVLASVWAETLGLKEVGIHDDFFELGGHSLLAMQLASRMSAALGLDISVKELFQHPTVGRLAEALGGSAPLRPAAPPSGREGETGAETVSAAASPPPHSAFVRYEARPLLPLFAAERLAPVEAAVLGYVPGGPLAQAGVDRKAFMQQCFGGLPLPSVVWETPWGRIAGLSLPWLDAELYRDRGALVESVLDALSIAGRMGAQTVSLAGLLPSATDYGEAVTRATGHRRGLPRVSTGHATTTAAVVMAIENGLRLGGRELAAERVGLIGAGSIGASTLRLMLRCLPHPHEVILCDVPAKHAALTSLQRDIVDNGFQGRVRVVTSTTSAPSEMYEATLVVGATNVPDVLDIRRVSPGTIIVDDSAPHCFDPVLAVRRFEEHADILFTEGGVLHSPQPITQLLYWDPEWARVMYSKRGDGGEAASPFPITGCALSGLLSVRFEELPPTIGPVDGASCLRHHAALGRLGLRAAPLRCRDYVLSERLVDDFRAAFSNG